MMVIMVIMILMVILVMVEVGGEGGEDYITICDTRVRFLDDDDDGGGGDEDLIAICDTVLGILFLFLILKDSVFSILLDHHDYRYD